MSMGSSSRRRNQPSTRGAPELPHADEARSGGSRNSTRPMNGGGKGLGRFDGEALLDRRQIWRARFHAFDPGRLLEIAERSEHAQQWPTGIRHRCRHRRESLPRFHDLGRNRDVPGSARSEVVGGDGHRIRSRRCQCCGSCRYREQISTVRCPDDVPSRSDRSLPTPFSGARKRRRCGEAHGVRQIVMLAVPHLDLEP